MSGQICAVLANIHRKDDAKIFGPSDFVPQLQALEEETEQATDEEEAIDLQVLSRDLERMLGKKDSPS